MGNGAKVAALAVGTYFLTLPGGLVLVLNNCYFVLAMSRNIISISSLALDGYKFVIENNNFSILKDNLFYGNVLLERGLYVLDLKNENYKSIYNFNTKRFKPNDSNPTYL